MRFSIQILDSFLVIGQETELTDSKETNMVISTSFWKSFNAELKRSGLSQSHGNWTKYAFMVRRKGVLHYYCAVPYTTDGHQDFQKRQIPANKYLVVEHHGAMHKIYDTYREVYKVLLPREGLAPLQSDFLHFEKYTHRFHWNREDSVIEIWIPVRE